MTIGDRIRIARKNAKLSQSDLGIKLDIGKSSVSEWESGKRPVPIDVVEVIASALDVTVPYLMGWSADSFPPIVSSSGLSASAIAIAKQYDALDNHGKEIVEAVVTLESKRIATDYAAETERFNSIAATESSAV